MISKQGWKDNEKSILLLSDLTPADQSGAGHVSFNILQGWLQKAQHRMWTLEMEEENQTGSEGRCINERLLTLRSNYILYHD